VGLLLREGEGEEGRRGDGTGRGEGEGEGGPPNKNSWIRPELGPRPPTS